MSKERPIKDILEEFLYKIKRGKITAEKIIYINNLIENGLIDMYWNGKIGKDKLDSFLYRDVEFEDTL